MPTPFFSAIQVVNLLYICLHNIQNYILKTKNSFTDTENIYDKVIGDILRSYGKEYTPDVWIKVLGTSEVDTSKILVKELQLPITPEEFRKQCKPRCLELFTNVKFMPGAERLVRHLHKHKIPIAVATSSARDSVDRKSQHHQEVFSFFHHIVCFGSDPEVKNGKPAPDIFLTCASRFPDKPAPEEVI